MQILQILSITPKINTIFHLQGQCGVQLRGAWGQLQVISGQCIGAC